MVEVQGKISNGEMIYLKNYINAVADMEREIVDKVNMGDISVLRKDKIKTKDSYKQEPMSSKYFHHVLWEKIFPCVFSALVGRKTPCFRPLSGQY